MNRVGLVDTNHNFKNLHYQVIGWSCALLLGDYVTDPRMLVLGGMAKGPKDWSSDLLSLKLNSADTIYKLLALGEEIVRAILATSTLTQLKL